MRSGSGSGIRSGLICASTFSLVASAAGRNGSRIAGNGSRLKLKGPVKSHYYSQHAVALRAELGTALSRDQMRDLHRKSAWRHLSVAARQFAILGLATWGLIRFENPLLWLPLTLVQG